MLPRKTSLTILTLAMLLGILAWSKVLRPVDMSAVADFRPREIAPAAPLLKHPFRGGLPPAPRQKDHPPEMLEDATHQLYPFYHALSLIEKNRNTVSILHYGDSPTTADSITADMRSLLQEKFGDAGHGFVLIAKPWPWYGHRGIDVQGTGWRIEPSSQNRAKDGYHGLGGVSFTGGPGASSHIRLETPHRKAEVSYLRQPEGGVFTVAAGDQQLGEVETHGEKASAFAEFALPAQSHEITISVKSGTVRLFGASFEKNAPGVIYNSLGVNGGQVQVMLRYFDRAHWAQQLQHRKPDLVIINYGTNESGFATYIDTLYAKELREVIERLKAALPGTPILIMSPMDRGERHSDGTIGTVAALPKLVAIQRQTALDTGCAFFNTFEAMGGAGTMARWYEMRPRLISADFMHPLPQGARQVALLLEEALMSGYERYTSQLKSVQAPVQVSGRH